MAVQSLQARRVAIQLAWADGAASVLVKVRRVVNLHVALAGVAVSLDAVFGIGALGYAPLVGLAGLSFFGDGDRGAFAVDRFGVELELAAVGEVVERVVAQRARVGRAGGRAARGREREQGGQGELG